MIEKAVIYSKNSDTARDTVTEQGNWNISSRDKCNNSDTMFSSAVREMP